MKSKKKLSKNSESREIKKKIEKLSETSKKEKQNAKD